MIITTKTIVFSALKYGEADLIVTCFTEKEGVIAHNKVHHSSKYPSQIRLPILSD